VIDETELVLMSITISGNGKEELPILDPKVATEYPFVDLSEKVNSQNMPSVKAAPVASDEGQYQLNLFFRELFT
jgi:hypothetical protein